MPNQFGRRPRSSHKMETLMPCAALHETCQQLGFEDLRGSRVEEDKARLKKEAKTPII